ncbi:Ktr system potassium transporter B [Rhodobacteraceae bacterium CCMM004]|nr:Ktr system potassium transporter B [Rhodobacteraceae bacterium CCMM004]
MTPWATTAGITLADALFTATSAVTVTGLVVVDTGSAFTFFGQAVIAVLIQLGGLGLMTFAALVLLTLGLPMGLPGRIVLQQDLNQTSLHNLMVLVRVILVAALICETVGVAVLATVLIPEFGLWPGLWSAVFHTISAFNNAGFALYPDSLSQWVGNPVMVIAVPAMFILGGLGFIVIADILKQRRWSRLTLHSRLMLAGTAILIVWACVSFAVLEWTNPGTLGPLSLGDKIAASWFQGVTPRTAGFNTVDIGATRDSTAVMIISLMLIGGGSTSTAGGIKVTTFIVLFLATIAFFRGRTQINAFGRSIGSQEVLKVLALTTVSMVLVMVGVFLVSLSNEGDFLDYAFEVASAFGTVGLSRGSTGELDALGRSVIIVMMFLGRVGPLTLGFFLATRAAPRVRYPEGRILLG